MEPTDVAALGYAHVDLQRRARCGFPEVIFCEGKAPEWVEGVVRQLVEAGQDCLATRVNAEQAAHLANLFPQARQDRVARTFWLPTKATEERKPAGKVFVLTAGTSDLPVAREAAVTAAPIRAETIRTETRLGSVGPGSTNLPTRCRARRKAATVAMRPRRVPTSSLRSGQRPGSTKAPIWPRTLPPGS